MNLHQFYGLLRDVVEQYPETEESYQRLQTFAVLQSISDLNADNLGHSVFSKGTNYFYSRRWESANHAANNVVYFPPLLYALPVSNVFVDPFQVRAYQHVTIEIGALYPNLEKTENTFAATCKRVNRDNIYVLAADWMDYVFAYLSKAAYANTDVDAAYRWYNQDKLEADILSGAISSYTMNPKKTSQFRSDLKNANPRTGGNFVDNFSKNNFCGAFYTVVVPVQYCRGTSSWTVTTLHQGDGRFFRQEYPAHASNTLDVTENGGVLPADPDAISVMYDTGQVISPSYWTHSGGIITLNFTPSGEQSIWVEFYI